MHCYFTLNNKMIFTKLDKVLNNKEGLIAFSKVFYHVLPEGILDHCLLILHLEKNIVLLFRFCSMWAQDPTFMEIVKIQWDS